MKITKTEVFVLGDPELNDGPSDGSRVDGLAFVRIHTDEGLTGLSEIFCVPPGVAQAVLDGPDSLFGHQLLGEDPIHPERLWTKLYNSMLHGNRRGWVIICLGAVDVALWDLYGKSSNRPVWQLLGGAERANHQITSVRQRLEAVPYCTIVSDEWDRESVLRQQVERVLALRERGYRAFKVEPMRQTRETIVELTRLTREAVGPRGPLRRRCGLSLERSGGGIADHQRGGAIRPLLFRDAVPGRLDRCVCSTHRPDFGAHRGR